MRVDEAKEGRKGIPHRIKPEGCWGRGGVGVWLPGGPYEGDEKEGEAVGPVTGAWKSG